MSPPSEPPVPQWPSRKIIQQLEKHGWKKKKGGGKGSHTKMVKPGRADPIIIKHSSQIATWIVRDYLKVAGLSVTEFLNPSAAGKK